MLFFPNFFFLFNLIFSQFNQFANSHQLALPYQIIATDQESCGLARASSYILKHHIFSSCCSWVTGQRNTQRGKLYPPPSHTWAHRRPRLVSVTLTNRREWSTSLPIQRALLDFQPQMIVVPSESQYPGDMVNVLYTLGKPTILRFLCTLVLIKLCNTPSLKMQLIFLK